MKILMLSWRDIKHPYGGGAEDLAHQMAKRWINSGNEVTHFSALFPSAQKREIIDGVTYLRDGDWYNVHLKAFIKLISGQLSGFDVIVDEVHGIPFFVKLYSRTPVVCLACEVAKEIWDQMYSFPINLIGKILESVYLLLYRKVPFLTISNSTKQDLIDNGVGSDNITILPMGFSYTLPKNLPQKNKIPTIIFLGRLVKTKGIEDAIQAFSLVGEQAKDAKMIIVGRGLPEYEQHLKRLVNNLNLTKIVEFKGFVSQEDKFKYLAMSHLILVPSSHEGWGLIVPEANIVGTPAIVYNVHGLRDVTKHGINGIIVKENRPEALAEESIKLLRNKNVYQKLSKSAKRFAQSMRWEDTAEAGLEVLKNVVIR